MIKYAYIVQEFIDVEMKEISGEFRAWKNCAAGNFGGCMTGFNIIEFLDYKIN